MTNRYASFDVGQLRAATMSDLITAALINGAMGVRGRWPIQGHLADGSGWEPLGVLVIDDAGYHFEGLDPEAAPSEISTEEHATL